MAARLLHIHILFVSTLSSSFAACGANAHGGMDFGHVVPPPTTFGDGGVIGFWEI